MKDGHFGPWILFLKKKKEGEGFSPSEMEGQLRCEGVTPPSTVPPATGPRREEVMLPTPHERVSGQHLLERKVPRTSRSASLGPWQSRCHHPHLTQMNRLRQEDNPPRVKARSLASATAILTPLCGFSPPPLQVVYSQ